MPMFALACAIVLDMVATAEARRTRAEVVHAGEFFPGTAGATNRYGALAMSAATLAALAQGTDAYSSGVPGRPAFAHRNGQIRPVNMPPPLADEFESPTLPLPEATGAELVSPLDREVIHPRTASPHGLRVKSLPRPAQTKIEPVGCPQGIECIKPDCHHNHPELKKLHPRQKNAQVVVVREMDDGEWSVLLQRRGHETEMCAGMIATIGGRREDGDRDSRDTAIRELFEETGLLDLGHVPGAPKELQELARLRRASEPLDFRLFARGKFSDWYVLVLDGGGTYTPARDRHRCGDMSAIARLLRGAVPAPAFGHAWVPLRSALTVEPWEAVAGLSARIRQAIFALQND
mmetsp:Transcript_82961/g.232503  ORF Transcript_82961/g.232503 Transcript_82961/m.232503 type:complete len:348 (-) Transcript_82961:115-1158(-)